MSVTSCGTQFQPLDQTHRLAWRNTSHNSLIITLTATRKVTQRQAFSSFVHGRSWTTSSGYQASMHQDVTLISLPQSAYRVCWNAILWPALCKPNVSTSVTQFNTTVKDIFSCANVVKPLAIWPPTTCVLSYGLQDRRSVCVFYNVKRWEKLKPHEIRKIPATVRGRIFCITLSHLKI
jgi:hypothetical protein